MIHLKFYTPSFSFDVYGEDEQKLRAQLADAWKVHCDQTGADPKYLEEFEGDIEAHELQTNVVYRDGHVFLDA